MSIRVVSVISFPGNASPNPRLIGIETTDSFATITTAGWLSNTNNTLGMTFLPTDFLFVNYSGGNGLFTLSFSGGVITLQAEGGNVITPTIANHIATYTDTMGTLSEDAATAINGGNIQAGLSGTAGYFASFPATAARGSLRWQAANSAGNTVTTVTNASQAAARTYTIPDGGQSASSFLLTDSAGTQTIATGSLALTAGNLTLTAGDLIITAGDETITAGNLAVTVGTITAGGAITSTGGAVISGEAAGGFQGQMQMFPNTAARGSLVWRAVDNAGDTATIFQTAALGQATTYTVPDPAGATGAMVVAPAALVNGNLVEASGTAGLVVDAGVAVSSLQLSANIIAAKSADIGGAGAGPISVPAVGLTSASVVVATVESSTSPVSVVACVAGTDGFDITFSADPGAACIVNYIAFVTPQ